MAEPLRSYIITPHAAAEMRRRGLGDAVVRHVLEAPEQRASVRVGRDVLQAKFEFAHKHYLVRVFVDVDRIPAEVITAYRTGKIAKYWRPDE